MRIKIGGKNTKANKTSIILNIILDASGSMLGKRSAVIGGFNEYVQTVHKQNPESSFVVNVLSFDTEVKHLYTGVGLDAIPEMTKEMYCPEGGTALYDAVGEAIYQSDSQKRMLGDATVLTFIFTDGEENSSTKFKSEVIKSLIQARELSGDWTFTFIGADKNCLNQAVQQMGIRGMNAIQFEPANFAMSMSNLAQATHTYSNGVNAGTLRSTQCFYKDAGLDVFKNLDEQDITGNGTITTTGNITP